MNIIFLTLLDFNSFSERNIYCDLLREFIANGHDVYCISPIERRYNISTHFEEDNHLLKLKIGNTQKTNLLEKGISTLMIEYQFVNAIKKYFSDVKFDLILYSTPPITLGKAVAYLKKRDSATTYLMLKDIFPQNAVDLGMLSTTGIKGIIYKYFRSKEKKLYDLSDYIGCMSPANVNYVLKHNSQLDANKVGLCPNAIEIRDVSLSDDEKTSIREKYGIPNDKVVFVYGGNLGKPQGITYIIETLKTQVENNEIFFLIIGSGTEADKLKEYITSHQSNMKFINSLPREEYEKLVSSCDVGLIYLDSKFTIPNFPSRMLSYLQAKLPIIACTDANTDAGDIITSNNFGWWCESVGKEGFVNCVQDTLKSDLKTMGKNGYQYMKENYSVSVVYKNMEKCFK